ncbi:MULTISPECIES: chemotaxis protein CheB [unclassified Lentimicrobium]|uniref:chemotaxis protein CheB n=1 Tax=unclassified Lentimicrobium TaxID=2677434 RepID=UPI001557F3FF|nr:MULTISPECIES: chemotaxis protein CheB [unclassified Lentimicrobium]NPD46464.1 chemotaxis protein CheB [Lentimicrobium sp. S6]NPD86602.1 chemotaxis protein CheB [Lentimicrobium sp. L6]
MLDEKKKYQKLVIIGASAGGINAVRQVVSRLPKNFAAPIVVIQHMNSFMNMFFIDFLNSHSSLKVKEANHMELLLPGRVYYAPPNYHALLEEGRVILNADQKVNYSRPSIDVFFESAAFEEKENLIAVILTGANQDGSYGMDLINACGGTCVIQDPESAESPEMPRSAQKKIAAEKVFLLEDIAEELIRLTSN